MNEPNQNGSNDQNPTGLPTPTGQGQTNPADVENQPNNDLDKLEKENAQLDNYIAANGGIDKVNALLSTVEQKRNLVAQHKQARQENSNLAWEEKIETVAQATQQTNAQAPEQPVQSQMPKTVTDEINRNILKELQAQSEYIKPEEFQNGTILKQAAEAGIPLTKDGVLDRERLSNYVSLVNKARKSETAPMPSPSTTATIKTVEHQRIPEGQMTVQAAMAVIKASNASVKANKSAHPDFERAVKVMRTQKTL